MLKRKVGCFGIYAPARGIFLNYKSEHVQIKIRRAQENYELFPLWTQMQKSHVQL